MTRKRISVVSCAVVYDVIPPTSTSSDLCLWRYTDSTTQSSVIQLHISCTSHTSGIVRYGIVLRDETLKYSYDVGLRVAEHYALLPSPLLMRPLHGGSDNRIAT